MNYDLSIIIAHFKPLNLIENPLIKTISEINNQIDKYNIEIIIADDGSFHNFSFDEENVNTKIINDKKVYVLENEKLKSFLNIQKIKVPNISKWIYYPKVNNSMNKAFVTNCSVHISEADNLLLLDDDNYFISKNSISNLMELFKNYDLIIGQIKDNNNRLRSYGSFRVQGIGIGIKKSIFNKIGGLGEWTSDFSCAVDSDFWIKLYNYNQEFNLKGCYTNQISTFDSFFKRWKKYTKLFKEIKLRKKFYKLYKCKNYKNHKSNLARQKKLWLDNLIK